MGWRLRGTFKGDVWYCAGWTSSLEMCRDKGLDTCKSILMCVRASRPQVIEGSIPDNGVLAAAYKAKSYAAESG